MRSRIPTFLAAALLALATAAPASAASVADSFTVSGTFSVQGIPASVTYLQSGGPISSGLSDVVSFTAVVDSNASWEMHLSGSAFGAAGDAPNLPASTRQVQLALPASMAPGEVWLPAAEGWAGAPTSWAVSGGGFWPFGSAQARTDGNEPVLRGGPVTGGELFTELRVDVPAGTVADSYSGSVLFDFTSA